MSMDYIASAVDGVTAVAAERVNNLRDQARAKFATTAARGTAIATPLHGQHSYLATGDNDEGPWDYNGEAWRRPWNMPWGYVAQASRSTIQSGIGSSFTDLTGLTVTFTAVANRAYEVRCRVLLEKATTEDEVELILTNAANAQLDSLSLLKMNSLDITTFNISTLIGSISAGSTTFKMRGKTPSGTFNVRNDATVGRIWVIDAGPDGAPA